jgi:hypothetical protein
MAAERKCNGGPHGTWCGAPATVVCIASLADLGEPLQWYACDQTLHQEGARTLPIAEWWALLEKHGSRLRA